MKAIETITGPVSVLNRDDVDTDQIIPKQFLKRVERTGFGEFLFYDWIRDGEIELEPNPILVAGRNFGCGSSREHAVWALQDFGFEAVVAPSFADIFRGNSIGAGLVTAQAGENGVATLIAALAHDPDAQIVVDVADRSVQVPSDGLRVPFELPDYARWRLLEGLDDIGVTLRHSDAIAEFERRRHRWLPVSGPQAHANA
jgi:3-isopropylmalate/(R)-2-methylmalate dehydratase small subunit